MGFTPSKPPETGCYITGLTVHNALWDTTNSTIKAFDVHDEELSNQLPILHIRPRLWDSSAHEEKTLGFDCKISCSVGGTLCRDADNVIITVKLSAANEQDIRDLVERRVIICSELSPSSDKKANRR